MQIIVWVFRMKPFQLVFWLLLASIALSCSDPDALDTSGESKNFDSEELAEAISGRVVYTGIADGDHELYSWLPNSDEGALQLTDNSYWDDHPALSPDEKKIAFISDRTGNKELYVMNNDGSDVQQLTTNSVDMLTPRWSPNGEWLLFIRPLIYYDDPEIFVIRKDGSDLTQITDNQIWHQDARWSPDGKQILVSGNDTTGVHMYMTGLSGSAASRITDATFIEVWPEWSPDGSQIAYVSDPLENGAGEIYVAEADGSNQRRLTTNEFADAWPAWSPDGSQIAFINIEDGLGELYIIDVDGTNLRRITDDSWMDAYPRWSADGSTVFMLSLRDNGYHLVSVVIATGETQELQSDVVFGSSSFFLNS